MESQPRSLQAKLLIAAVAIGAAVLAARLIGPLQPAVSKPFVGVGAIIDYEAKPPVIKRVLAGSPAAAAGLLPGDRLTAVGDTPTEGLKPEQVQALIKGGGLPGSRVWLVVQRAGWSEAGGVFAARAKIKIVLKPVDIGLAYAPTILPVGLYVSDIEPDSPADKAGLKAGDVIVAIDGQEMTVESLRQAAVRLKGSKGTAVELAVLRVKPGADPADLLTLDPKKDAVKIKVVRDNIYMQAVEIIDTGLPEPKK